MVGFILTLIQKKGHLAKDCPEHSKGKGNRGGRNQGKRSRNGKSGPKSLGRRVPRAPPPKPGESEIEFIDEKKRFWCAECNC